MSRVGHIEQRNAWLPAAQRPQQLFTHEHAHVVYIYIHTTVSEKIHCTIAQLLKTRPKQNKPGLQRDLPVQAVPGSNHLKTAADTYQEHQHTLLVVSILIPS